MVMRVRSVGRVSIRVSSNRFRARSGAFESFHCRRDKFQETRTVNRTWLKADGESRANDTTRFGKRKERRSFEVSAKGNAFIRHGILSNADKLSDLTSFFEKRFKTWNVKNLGYDWTQSVLLSGINFARWIAESVAPGPILLVGHSQGGLLCRVAVAALVRPIGLLVSLERERVRRDYDSRYYRDAADALKAFLLRHQRPIDGPDDWLVEPSRIHALMLATPNCGAFTFGQMSILARLGFGLFRGPISKLAENLTDLQTDRLLRVLQSLEIKNARYGTISGSAINRHSIINHSDLGVVIPPLKALGIRLDLPNDMVVEDSSVDMLRAPLPTEVYDPDSQYKHIRTYFDCTDVSHSSIHSESGTNAYLAIEKMLLLWGL
jgi:hypothetical protein